MYEHAPAVLPCPDCAKAMQQAHSGRRWAELSEAAMYSRYSIRQLRTFIRNGTLSAYRVGPAGNIKVDLNDVDAMITGSGPVQVGIEVPTERERGSGRYTGNGKS